MKVNVRGCAACNVRCGSFITSHKRAHQSSGSRPRAPGGSRDGRPGPRAKRPTPGTGVPAQAERPTPGTGVPAYAVRLPCASNMCSVLLVIGGLLYVYHMLCL